MRPRKHVERFASRELIQDAAQRLMEFDREAIDPGDRS
jgi:hypothetical protein